MRQVSVIVHLDLTGETTELTEAELERRIRDAVLAFEFTVADAEVMPRPGQAPAAPRPSWPENVPARVELDEDVPNALRPTMRDRCRAAGWSV